MPGERRSHTHNRDRHDDSQALQVIPPSSASTVSDNNMCINQVPYGDGQAQVVPARPRIINQGHLKIYSDYTGNPEIINMPGSTMELVGSPYNAAPIPVEQYRSPMNYTSTRPTTTVTAAKPVARYYCLSCKARYFTQERLDQHVREYPYYCAECNCCRKRNGSGGPKYCCVWSTGGPKRYWIPGRGGAVDDSQ